jgi:AbrB family looped-hinge helix DNA binding protein
MKPARLTKKGQVTIPKAIRDFLEIETGDKVLFEIRGKDVVLIPIKKTIFDFRAEEQKGGEQ